MKPRALDLFCGAGGATRGLQLAGFHVTGVDINPQPRYIGDEFHQADALIFPLEGFDFIWASPPCQAYTSVCAVQRAKGKQYPALVGATRRHLQTANTDWVIENVVTAPLRSGIVLCGLSFGLPLLRHRRFESSFPLLAPPHIRHSRGMALRREVFTVAGSFGGSSNNGKRKSSFYMRARKGEAHRAMGIDWMDERTLMQAVPPAYAEFIGRQVLTSGSGSPTAAGPQLPETLRQSP